MIVITCCVSINFKSTVAASQVHLSLRILREKPSVGGVKEENSELSSSLGLKHHTSTFHDDQSTDYNSFYQQTV